jgi:hypothetical protein
MKRFLAERNDKKITFIPDDAGINLVVVSADWLPQIEVKYQKKNDKELFTEIVPCADFVDVMNWNAKGKRLNFGATIKSIKLLDPLPYDEPEYEEPEMLSDSADEDNDIAVTDIDAEIAKEIFESIAPRREDKPNGKEAPEDTEANQLLLF